MAGTSWIEQGDGSQMLFNEDGSFGWYKSRDEKDDNYFIGTYDFYIGQEAIDYLTNDLSEYGITEETVQAYFDINGNEEYSLENFVFFTTNIQSFILNGEEQFSEDKKTSYFGFLMMDGRFLDVLGMPTGAYCRLLKEED